VEALIQAHTQFNYGKSSGPVAVYKCEDCGNYHLTSKGPVNATLASYLKEGKIDKALEAEKWAKKFKGK
jgi:hypothetical protein